MSSTTAAATVASGVTYVPFTQTFVQTSGSATSTVAYTLVGQVLDNGQTNWVGYDDGSAEYLYTGSVANAVQTTLDGETYYVSSGSAPAGYLATAGGDETGATMAATSSGAMTTSSSGGSSSSSRMSTTGTSSKMTTAASGTAAATTSSSSGHRVSAGGAFALAMGLLAVMAL